MLLSSEELGKAPPTKPRPRTSITIATNINTTVTIHAKYLTLNKPIPSTQIPIPTKHRNAAIDVVIPLLTCVNVLIVGLKASVTLLAIIDLAPEVLLSRISGTAVSEIFAALLNTPIPKAMNTIPPTKIAIEIIVRPLNPCCCTSFLYQTLLKVLYPIQYVRFT